MRLSPALALTVLLYCAPAGAGDPLRLDVIERHLSNGLTLLMLENHKTPIVSCAIFYRVGSANEEPGRTGISHFLEHMMFKGTRLIGTGDYRREAPLLKKIEEIHAEMNALESQSDVKKSNRLSSLQKELAALEKEADGLMIKNELWKLYDRAGAAGLNASTGRDMTAYYCSLPVNALELWLRLESDRMANAVFREFYRERDVVLEERRLGTEDRPDGALSEQLFATSFIAHPYRWPVIGWKPDIAHFTPGLLREHYRRYYAPNNAIVVIAGDIHPERVFSLVSQYFAPIPEQPPAPAIVTTEPPQRGKREAHVEFKASPRIALAFHKPSINSEDTIALDVLENILSSGRTSRLYKSLVEQKKLAISVDASSPPSKYPFLFIFHAIPRRPHTNDEVEQGIREEIAGLSKEPPGEWEIRKAKNRIKADFIRDMESVSDLASLMGNYAVLDRWEYINRYIPKIKKVAAADITRVAEQYLREDNCTKVIIP